MPFNVSNRSLTGDSLRSLVSTPTGPRTLLAIIAIAVVSFLAVSASAQAQYPANVISRSIDSNGKGVFMDGASPWKSIGWNDYTLSNHPVLGDKNCGNPMSSEDFTRQMDRIKATGANTVRVWFFQRYFEEAPGTQEDKWKPFNRILIGANNRGMRVVPVLMNQWSACDRQQSPYKDSETGNLTTQFYDTQYTQTGGGPMAGYTYSAKAWAEKVAKRYNPSSAYSKTIAYFQLVNEAETRANPTSNSCSSNGPAVLRNFADVMTNAIKTSYQDGNPSYGTPLVSLGTMGIGQCGQKPEDVAPGDPNENRTEYEYIHAGAVDMCEVHDYDAMNEAWPSNVYGISGNSFQNRLDECGSKPFVIGEAGVKANVISTSKSRYDGTFNDDFATDSQSLNQRAQFFDSKMDMALNQKGVDGYQLWDKYFLKTTHSDNKATHENFGIGAPGDPTTCAFRNFTSASNCSTSVNPSPPNGAPDSGDFLHFTFEEDQGGWGSDQWNNLNVGVSSYVAFQGSKSLAVQMSSDASKKYSGVGTYYGLTNIEAGTSVTIRVHSAGDSAGVKVEPYVKKGDYGAVLGPLTVTLTGNGWQTINYTVPGSVDTVKAFGLHFINEGLKTGTVHVDAINW